MQMVQFFIGIKQLKNTYMYMYMYVMKTSNSALYGKGELNQDCEL